MLDNKFYVRGVGPWRECVPSRGPAERLSWFPSTAADRPAEGRNGVGRGATAEGRVHVDTPPARPTKFDSSTAFSVTGRGLYDLTDDGPRRGLRPQVLFASAALAGICLVALSAGDAGAAGAPDRAPRANGVGAPIAWGVCDPPDEDLQCATIRVPLDWDRPNGRTIRLALIRHLASKPEQRIGTIFMNPGGPGDSGVVVLRGDPEGFDAFGDGRFDVVSWDPRGTNASTRVRCFRDQGSRGEVLGRSGAPDHQTCRGTFCPKDRRAGAALR